MALQDAIDVGIEIDLDARFGERGKLLFRARGADVRPAIEHVRLLEAPFGMAFGHCHASRPRPIGHAPAHEGGGKAQVVLLGRLLADARATAFPHLARETWPAALFPSDEAPAQAVLAR